MGHLMTRPPHLLAAAFFSAILLMLAVGCADVASDRTLETRFNESEASSLNLHYRISLIEKDSQPRLQMKVSFVMPRNRIYLRLPDKYLRKENLFHRIEDLSVDSPGRLLAHPEFAAVRILEFPEGDQVTLHYLYRPDDPITYAVGKETFAAPIIRRDYFQFVASMAFVYPVAISGAPPFTLDIEWEVPSDFKIYNSFGAEQKTQSITTDFDKMRDAFFVAGRNIRSHRTTVRNQPVWITFEGEWENIPDADFISVVTRLLATQRATFADDKFPYFLVNFLSENVDCSEGGNIKFAGTAHPNSFRAVFPGGPQCVFKPEMRQLIAHELMHMWIGKIIRLGEESGHIDGKWFTEGFTDFFGRLLAYHAGVLSKSEFFSSLNRQLEKYFTSPERFVSLNNLVERMYRRGFSSRELEDVPYQQGEIMAWRLNSNIKLATSFNKGLVDVIKDMLADADKAGGFKKLTVKELAAYFDRYAPSVFAEEYAKIVHGKLFIPPSLGQCSEPETGNITQFRAVPQHSSSVIYSYKTIKSDCDRWLK